MDLLSRNRRAEHHAGEPQAGDLLALEALDRSGLAITSEGAFVRVIEAIPPNPLLRSHDERLQLAVGFRQLISALRPAQVLQIVIDARPVRLDRVLAEARNEVEAFSGAPPTSAGGADPLALSRWRLYAAMQDSLKRNASEQAAMDLRAYVVCPYWPGGAPARALRSPRALLASTRIGRRIPHAELVRDAAAHRRAVRESLTHTDAIRSELDALGIPSRALNGEQYARLLWRRFNPTAADNGATPPALDAEVLADLDGARDRREARLAAARLREAIATSLIDFRRDDHYVAVDRDVEQTIYANSIADPTYFGWLLNAMVTRQPFVISVFCHALDRREERRRLKRRHRRIFAINRYAEAQGRVPDFDRYAQENEQEQLLAEMASAHRTSLFRVSIYQALRARGPDPDKAALGEAVDYCANEMEQSVDTRVNRGAAQQRPLWLSTLPLGRDVHGRGKPYATKNAADCLPLVGTSCGSPRGIPFGFASPSRTLERLDPYDRTHANQLGVVAGRSGAGKTMLCNLLMARSAALGAHGFVIDRAGHYEVLTHLIDGAQQIELGDDDSGFAINAWDVPDPANVTREKVGFLSALHEVMMGPEGLDALERAQLGAAIRGVYALAAQSGDSPRESLLREVLEQRAHDQQDAGAPELAATLRNLAERLGEYCGEGAYAYLLDRPTTAGQDAPLVVFDTRRVPDAVLTPVMFSVLEFIVRAIERHASAHRERMGDPAAPMFLGRSVVLIDEAWKLLEAGRSTGAYMNDLARRSRHLGLFMLVSSQQLSDFDTEYGVALLRNSTLQFLLAQHADEVPFCRDALRLSEEEAAILGRLKTVKGSHSELLFVNGERGRGQLELRVGPTEYWAFTSDPLKDVPARERAREQQGGDMWAAIAQLANGSGPRGDSATSPPPVEG